MHQPGCRGRGSSAEKGFGEQKGGTDLSWLLWAISASAMPGFARTTLLALGVGGSCPSPWGMKKQCFLQHVSLLENIKVGDVRVPPPGPGGSDHLITGIPLCLHLPGPLPTVTFSPFGIVVGESKKEGHTLWARAW